MEFTICRGLAAMFGDGPVLSTGAADSGARPHVFGGLGATTYGQADFTGAGGVARSIGGVSRFSSTWGAGVNSTQHRT